MRSRMLLCAAVLTAGVLSMSAAAQERATFILNDGQRLTGTIVAPAYQRWNNRTRTEFTVAGNNRREQTISAADVAIIDFVGGAIPRRELQSLPDAGQALVMRNGSVRSGQFVGLTDNDQVQWANTRGGEVSIPMANVRRVYLNTNTAFQLFDPRGSLGNTGAYRPNGVNSYGDYGNYGNYGNALTVRATQRWNDTGMDVRAGEQYDFSARGRITWSRGDDQMATADGNGVRVNVGNFPVPAMAVGGLVAKVGVNGEPFPIGSSQAAVRMPTNGRLYLGVNDDNFSDNSGAFQVSVSRVR